MRDSLADVLRVLAPAIPPQIRGVDAVDRLCEMTRGIPASLTNEIYLECRLMPESGVIDTVVHLDERARDRLIGVIRADDFREGITGEPLWVQVVELCRRWAAPDSALHRVAQSMWLEFDAAGWRAGDRLPQPGIFVGFRPIPGGDRTGLQRAITEVVETAPDPPPASQLECLWRCVRELPRASSVAYIGLFGSRQCRALRLCLTGLAEHELPPLLSRIDWPGDPHHLEYSLARISRDGGRRVHPGCGMVHLDVEEGVRPRLGLEYPLERRPQATGFLREQPFFDHLVRQSLCGAGAREGLGRWPGLSRERFPHQLWPSRVFRRVNHIKVVTDGGAGTECKGYLCVFYDPMPGRRGATSIGSLRAASVH